MIFTALVAVLAFFAGAACYALTGYGVLLSMLRRGKRSRWDWGPS